jgi:TPR repeat protein
MRATARRTASTPAAEARETYAELDAGGYAAATFALGWRHFNSFGVAKDKAEAARLFRKAIDLGNAAAMINLGAQYANGDGVAPRPLVSIAKQPILGTPTRCTASP